MIFDPKILLGILLTIGGAGALLACSAPAPEKSAHRDSRIIGGTEDKGDPAIVAVYAAKDDQNGSICTGEIIAPTVVLTASHCVDPRALGFNPQGIVVVTSPDITTKVPDDQILKIKSANAHPQYDPESGANDIAIIELAAPTAIPPLPFHREALEPHTGKSARIVGYGTTKDGDDTSSGKKNEATVQIAQITAASFLAAALPTTQCHGDSGGPVLLDIGGKETIIGVGWRTVRNDGLCAEGVLDTRVDPYVAFIDAFLGNGGGQGAPGEPGDPGGDPGNGQPGQPGDPGQAGEIVCCFNGSSFDCPSAAACLGGFDINACMNACQDTDCIVACADKASAANGPTAECKPDPNGNGRCNGGQ